MTYGIKKNIDVFINSKSNQKLELQLLRNILLESGLDEAMNWGRSLLCFTRKERYGNRRSL
ncbi:MAG: hypothetical protein ACI9XP_000055 [Lentimonas sp.]|jgi:hypothetical protein